MNAFSPIKLPVSTVQKFQIVLNLFLILFSSMNSMFYEEFFLDNYSTDNVN